MGEKRIDFTGAADDGRFVYVFPAIIMSFILISLWADFINKFYYGVLGFCRQNAGDALLLAAMLTFFLGVFISVIPSPKEKDSK